MLVFQLLVAVVTGSTTLFRNVDFADMVEIAPARDYRRRTISPTGPSRFVSSIVPGAGGSTPPPGNIEFEVQISPMGLWGQFRVNGGDRVNLLMDTSSPHSMLDYSNKWPTSVPNLKVPYLFEFGGSSSAVAFGAVTADLRDIHLTDQFLIGQVYSGYHPFAGIVSLSPRSTLGKRPFALMRTDIESMLYTTNVIGIDEHCIARRVVSTDSLSIHKNPLVSIPLDTLALKHQNLFVIPSGTIRVGSQRHATSFLVSTGFEGIELPFSLYQAFLDKLDDSVRQNIEIYQEKYILLDPGVCQQKVVDLPRISVTLKGESQSITIRLSSTDYLERSNCLIPVRVAKHDDRIAFGPAFLKRAVTVFGKKNIKMCRGV